MAENDDLRSLIVDTIRGGQEPVEVPPTTGMERQVDENGREFWVWPQSSMPSKTLPPFTGPVSRDEGAPQVNPEGTPPEVAPEQPNVVPSAPVMPGEVAPVSSTEVAPMRSEEVAEVPPAEVAPRNDMAGVRPTKPVSVYDAAFPNTGPRRTPNRMESLITGAQAAPNSLQLPEGTPHKKEIEDLNRIAEELTNADSKGVVRLLEDYGVGFADKLARRIGGAGDMMTARPIIDRALQSIGNVLMDNPDALADMLAKGRLENMMVENLHAMGMPKADLKNFMTEVGSEQVDSFIMLAALRAAGPRLQALGDTTKTRRFFKRLGDAVVGKPAHMVLMDMLGSTPGAVAGKRFADEMAPNSTVAGFVGAFAGSAAATGVAYKLMKWIESPFSLIRGMRRNFQTAPANSIIDERALPMSAKVFSEQQISADQVRIENAIQDAINMVQKPMRDPRTYQEHVYKGLSRAEDIAEGVERTYWNKVTVMENRVPPGVAADPTTGTPGSGLLPGLDALEKEMIARSHRETEVPTEVIERIRNMYPGFYDPTQKTVTYSANIQKMRSEIRAIRREIREEWAKLRIGGTGVPNAPRAANLNQIVTYLNDAIQTAGAGDRNLTSAIAMSREVYNLFGQGTIAGLLSTTKTGTGTVRPYHTVKEMLKDVDGLEDVLKMSARMQSANEWRSPSGRRLLNAGERTELKQMEMDVANSIRSEFHVAVDNARQSGRVDANEAVKLLRQLEVKVKPLASVAMQVHSAGMQLAALQEEGRVLAKGAFARYAQMDADKAVMNVMAQKDPAATTKQLLDGAPATAVSPATPGFRSDPDALRGFQNGLMNMWMNNNMKAGGLDAGKFQRFLAEPKIRRVVNETWKKDEIARLDKLVDIAVRSEKGEISSWSQSALPTSRLLARIIGAKTGRVIGSVTGQPTIQVPSIVAQSFSEKVTAFLQAFDPSTTLVHAMRDPHYEALLLRQEPLDAGNGVQMLKVLRNHLRRAEAVRQGAQDDYETRAINEPAETQRLKKIIKETR